MVVAADEQVRLPIERFGLDFVGLPSATLAPEFKRTLERLEGVDRASATFSMFFDYAASSTDPLAELAEEMGADVILRGQTAWGAIFAGEMAGIPSTAYAVTLLDRLAQERLPIYSSSF